MVIENYFNNACLYGIVLLIFTSLYHVSFQVAIVTMALHTLLNQQNRRLTLQNRRVPWSNRCTLQWCYVSGFCGHFYFRILKTLFGFVVTTMICDLVYDVETKHCLCKVLASSGNLFLNISGVRITAKLSGHHSYFRKDCQMLLYLIS